MQTRSTRIAYLKRMLRRSEGEARRIEQMISTGDLQPSEPALFVVESLIKDRESMTEELRRLEGLAGQSPAPWPDNAADELRELAERLASRTNVEVSERPAAILRRERDQR